MKRVIFYSLSILLALGLSSCMKPKDSDAGKKIVIWEQEDNQVAPYIDATIEAFKALPENKDVKISRTHYNTEDLVSQFQTASIAGSAPDLLMSPSDTAGVYSISGFILPVNDKFDMSLYNKTVVDAITLDGKTWGVPISNGNHLMLFYNKKLVKKAPKTTEELFEFCEKNKTKLKSCLAFNIPEPFWFVPWLGAYGGWPINGRTPTLDTEAVKKTLNFYLDLKFKKKFIPLECDYNCADSLFKEEKAAFLINGDWAISTYQKILGKNLAIAKLPKVSATDKWPSPMVSGKYFMLSSALRGKQLELVKRFVAFYTNKDNQIAQIRTLKRLPALKAATEADIIKNDPLLQASMNQIYAGKPMSMATEMRAIWDTMRPHLGKALTKKETVAEAAKKMQLDAVLKIKEMND
jgi:arabinogalactan oligomer/maltooligosaccharide transport system substrate-binding protein